MNERLFEGERLRLAGYDHDHDPAVEARWTEEAEYLRLLDDGLVRPLSPAQVKKKQEEREKDAEKGQADYYFTVRLLADDRLLGFVRLSWIEWWAGGAFLKLGIGSPTDWGQGYGREALQLILGYGFQELNLHRIFGVVAECNPRAISLLTRAGFQVEVRKRHARFQDGRRYDVLGLALMRPEWEAARKRSTKKSTRKSKRTKP